MNKVKNVSFGTVLHHLRIEAYVTVNESFDTAKVLRYLDKEWLKTLYRTSDLSFTGCVKKTPGV